MNPRRFLPVAAICALAFGLVAHAADSPPAAAPAPSPEERLADLEAAAGGRLGVYALDTANGAQLGFRANERFPFCSTFKLVLVSAILARSAHEASLMQQRLHFGQGDLVHYSPIAEKHLADGMTVAELSAAALQYSDNTAANLLIGLAGGTAAVTAYAASIGNEVFRLDRRETELNSAIPGDPRDTVSPGAMTHSLQVLALGDALPAVQRQQLVDWLRGNTTGDGRIRAGVPAGWQVADKTGTGGYGTTNDIGLLWPPQRKPILLAVYYTQEKPDAQPREDVIASATRIVVDAFARGAGTTDAVDRGGPRH